MSGLNELSKNQIQDQVDFDNLPEQMGGFTPPPQPGPYRFQLSPLSDSNFEPVQSVDFGDRVKVKFDDAAPLIIIQSPGGVRDGEPFHTQISNVPRARDKAKSVFAADFDYLLKFLGVKVRPKTPREYAEVLMQLAAKRAQFGADIEWSWSCNPKREARFPDGTGGFTPLLDEETQTPKMGCGRRYYQQNVKKVTPTNEQGEATGPAEFPLTIACACGADVRGFANLTRFKE